MALLDKMVDKVEGMVTGKKVMKLQSKLWRNEK